MTSQPSENTHSSPSTEGVTPAGAEAKSRVVAVVWAVACVLIVAIMAGVYVVDRVITSSEKAGKGTATRIDTVLNIPQAVAEKLAGAFQTKTTLTTLFMPVIHEIQEKPKLVVMVTTMNVTVKKDSVKTTALGALDLGTTTVTLRANGNRVQYFVPLKGAGLENFSFDPASKILTATFPPVQVDKQVVDVQSNPAMVDIRTDAGWARLDRYSGEELRDQAKKDLQTAVIEEAGTPLLMDKARESARKQLKKMLEPLALAMKEDVKLKVRFEDEAVVVD